MVVVVVVVVVLVVMMMMMTMAMMGVKKKERTESHKRDQRTYLVANYRLTHRRAEQRSLIRKRQLRVYNSEATKYEKPLLSLPREALLVAIVEPIEVAEKQNANNMIPLL